MLELKSGVVEKELCQAQVGLAACHLGKERSGALLSLQEHVWTPVKHPQCDFRCGYTHLYCGTQEQDVAQGLRWGCRRPEAECFKTNEGTLEDD